MYDELVKRLRNCIDSYCAGCKYESLLEPGNFVKCMNALIGEAADAIEELQEDKAALNGTVSNLIEQIAELSKPRWIPVTERLPLYGQDVLAVRTYGDGEKCQEVLMAHIAIWDERTGEKWWNATNITHWMPLPSAPAEE